MLDNKLLQLINETGAVLELPTAVIEKDYNEIIKIANLYIRDAREVLRRKLFFSDAG